MRGGAVAVLLMSLLLLGAKQKALWRLESPSTWPEAAEDNDDYPKLELGLAGLTDKTYGAFIAQLRKMLESGEEIWTLAVLGSRASVPMSRRFVLVDVTNYAGETIELAVDVTNVYIVGYRVGNDSFFTRPDDPDTAQAITHLFPGTERHMLPFTGRYGALQEAAGANRENIPLGAGALDDSVRAMNLYAASPTPVILHSVARGLIVCIQMISEAARFRYIEFEMKSRIRRSVNSEPDPSVIELENSWDPLSTAIQRSSNDGGVFDTPILLQRCNYSRFEASDVLTVLPYISLLLFYCAPPRKELLHDPLIRLPGGGGGGRGEPTCPTDVEPTSRIQGPDGLCVDVRDGHYNNGNPVQLWSCKSNDDANQLWTFRSDGTLRSNGKCLASYGYTSGDYIMIYDCDTVDAFIWHSWPNGTIASPSGLVLSAHSSASGTTLSARDNEYATGQSWLPTNSTGEPPAAYQIAGAPSGLHCLHAEGDDDVVLRECAGMEEAGSWWALYPDGSIRPHERRSLCLAPPDTQAARPFKTVRCDPSSYLQRWLLENDGTLVSLRMDLVMDVRGPPVPGAHLILNAWAGTATQGWQPLL